MIPILLCFDIGSLHFCDEMNLCCWYIDGMIYISLEGHVLLFGDS